MHADSSGVEDEATTCCVLRIGVCCRTKAGGLNNVVNEKEDLQQESFIEDILLSNSNRNTTSFDEVA
jgi:hypothetical protein